MSPTKAQAVGLGTPIVKKSDPVPCVLCAMPTRHTCTQCRKHVCVCCLSISDVCSECQ